MSRDGKVLLWEGKADRGLSCVNLEIIMQEGGKMCKETGGIGDMQTDRQAGRQGDKQAVSETCMQEGGSDEGLGKDVYTCGII